MFPTLLPQLDSTPASDEGVLGAAEMRQLHREFPGRGLRVVIQMFEEEGQTMLEQIASAAWRGDAEALRRAAHAMRGAVANFGARRLEALCQEIEAGARGGDLSRVAGQLEQVREQYDRVELALKKECLN
ncbi:MAG TPA: Hpt domain-containing protein [Chthoniobacteraceae bacterium]|jgi:HPt (histidine-containing phosphotransfer) domain-containing protein|nr:Hpt domain-containing protein [Chthoniobacteraceae bacterium]